jgi:hypothetical protein
MISGWERLVLKRFSGVGAMANKTSLTKLERAAYHEAGHAVASYLVHRRLACVSIIPNPIDNTLGHCEYRNLADFKPDAPMNSRLRVQIEKLIIVLLAGAIAERLRAGSVYRNGSEDDMTLAYNAAMYLSGEAKEARAFVNWLSAHTRNLLASGPQWAAVEALAGELTERRFIGERLARQIIRKALAAS